MPTNDQAYPSVASRRPCAVAPHWRHLSARAPIQRSTAREYGAARYLRTLPPTPSHLHVRNRQMHPLTPPPVSQARDEGGGVPMDSHTLCPPPPSLSSSPTAASVPGHVGPHPRSGSCCGSCGLGPRLARSAWLGLRSGGGVGGCICTMCDGRSGVRIRVCACVRGHGMYPHPCIFARSPHRASGPSWGRMVAPAG